MAAGPLLDGRLDAAGGPPTMWDAAPPASSQSTGGAAEAGAVTAAATAAVSVPGSGLVFNNTFAAGVSAAYMNCVTTAEQTIASQWTNAVTINLRFNTTSVIGGFLASNSFSVVTVSYAQLTGALASHQFSSYAQSAAASLPLSDPSGGRLWTLPTAYARMLGLSGSSPLNDDAITLNTAYNWSFGQDVINTIEHELTEGGMGRIGGLGDQNGDWSTMDLFRYSAPGVRDFSDGRDGQTTHFSADGAQLSSLTFNNQFHFSAHVDSGDTADFIESDVFGTGSPGETITLSQTDSEVMDVLGWAPHVGINRDVNGDGISDVLWRNSGGTVAIWEMNGAGVIGNGVPGGADPFAWHIRGTGDFNGDGMADVLWQNADGTVDIWQMNGLGLVGGGPVGGADPGSWTLTATGDFNHDGKSDVLWRDVNGAVDIWEMNGTSIIGGGVVGAADASWHIRGTGDFNGDGSSDVLWQNDSGLVDTWELNGTNLIGGGVVGAADPSWRIAGIADFNGDGRSDVLWQHNSGLVDIWELSGTALIGGGAVGAADPASWAIVPPDSTGDLIPTALSTAAPFTL